MNLVNFTEENARTYLEKILAILDIEATVAQEDIDDTTICYRIECKADDARLLIGRNGQTLEALQFVVRQMCKTNQANQNPFVVDVLDYRSRRRRNLEDQAKKAAVAVLNGESDRVSLIPMSPYERRIVHKYLQENFEELASESEGEGANRHIVITYRGLPGDGAADERDGEDESDEFSPEEAEYGLEEESDEAEAEEPEEAEAGRD
ncbi:MAG TPA: R3H domain-containing nucleic acid-binding protein [Candidatus Obscuribacterales bacterium]